MRVSEATSEWVKQVSEASVAKQSKAECCGASEQSEQCKGTNAAGDGVARQKRDCLWLETRPKSLIWKKVDECLQLFETDGKNQFSLFFHEWFAEVGQFWGPNETTAEIDS